MTAFKHDAQGNIEISIDLEVLRKRRLFLAAPMYGGSCAGMFCRSVMDLAARMAKYEIHLQVYFLFNESLITRARNYCCDEFLRSDCTHMMFIDSDIGFNPDDVLVMLSLMSDESEYDVMAGPYAKKSATYDTLIETEQGPQKLGEMVKKKYTGKVLTINEKTGKLEWNRVLTHSESLHNGKQWVKIGRYGRKNITVTHDHECLFIADPLKPDIIERARAENMVGKYIIRNPKTAGKNSIHPLMNSEQISIMVGTMMGDGSIRNGYLRFGHSDAQKEYLDIKHQIFGGRIRGPIKSGTYTAIRTVGNTLLQEERDYYAYHMTAPINAQILRMEELMYVDGKKTPKNVINMLTDIGLAFWYMDDGSLCKNGNNGHHVEFCSEGFDSADNELLAQYINANWNIDAFVTSSNRIKIRDSGQDRFFSLIAKYIPLSMEYKLTKQYRGGKKHVFNTKKLDFAAEKVKEVRLVTDGVSRNQYDIGVENNHNYVAENYIISNCISWEKVKQACDRGFGDDNPNDLAKYIGDYVFNPKLNSGEIPINQPVEVLEAGTGFMMIRRKTFEKYQEKFPELLYKPDHVRTAAFDGSREIMAFFDCIIEPLSKRYLSEDYMFCYNVQKIGMKVWFCPWMKLSHVGAYVFDGSLSDLAQIGASATADIDKMNQIKGIDKRKGQKVAFPMAS